MLTNEKRKLPAVVGLVALAAVSAGAFQQAGRGAGHPTAVGRLAHYEAAERVVSLETPSGVQQFVLATDAVVREGVRSIGVERLEKLIGRTAKVRYQNAGSRRVARQLTVAAPGRPPARTAATPTSTPRRMP